MAPKPKEEAPQRFIKLVVKTMKDNGLSLRTVASRANMDPATLSRILTGQQGLPTDKAIVKLSRALGMRDHRELFLAARRIPNDRYYPELFRVTSKLTSEDKIKILVYARKLAGERP